MPSSILALQVNNIEAYYMFNNLKTPIMALVSLLGFASLTTTEVVAASDTNYQRLFSRNNNSNRIIRKEDLEKEGDTFYKVTNHNNVIEFNKSNNLVRNITPLTGLESVTLASSNSYLQISSRYREDNFLYEKYLRNVYLNIQSVLIMYN